MFYAFFKGLFYLLFKVFYRGIHLENRERVPGEGPLILVSSHPNTMMDPVMLALVSGRNPYFLGKSTLFTTPFTRWFFGKGRVLPVYRKQDAAAEMDKNEQTFIRCYEALEEGRAIVIMPEGLSQLDGTLHPIKTGTARIALGTEARNDFKLGITIVPVGINYSDPTKFNQDVYCRFGQPIDINEYRELYEEDQVEAVYQMTDRIRVALEKLTTTVRVPEAASVLSNLSKIYKQDLLLDQGLRTESKNADFSITRGMVDAIHWFHERDPEHFEDLSHRMKTYLAKIEGLELRDDLLSTSAGQKTLLRRIVGATSVLLGFPVYLWGLVNNYIPYRLPRVVVRLLKPTVEFMSTYKLASGFIMVLIFYALQTWIVWQLTASILWSILYLVSLIPSWKFSLYYQETMQNYRQHIRFITLFYRRKTLVYEIIQERAALLEALDEAKQRYLDRDMVAPEADPGPEDGRDAPGT